MSTGRFAHLQAADAHDDLRLAPGAAWSGGTESLYGAPAMAAPSAAASVPEKKILGISEPDFIALAVSEGLLLVVFGIIFFAMHR